MYGGSSRLLFLSGGYTHGPAAHNCATGDRVVIFHLMMVVNEGGYDNLNSINELKKRMKLNVFQIKRMQALMLSRGTCSSFNYHSSLWKSKFDGIKVHLMGWKYWFSKKYLLSSEWYFFKLPSRLFILVYFLKLIKFFTYSNFKLNIYNIIFLWGLRLFKNEFNFEYQHVESQPESK